MNIDSALVTLLDLHGSVLDQGGGYWIKIDAWAVWKYLMRCLREYDTH